MGCKEKKFSLFADNSLTLSKRSDLTLDKSQTIDLGFLFNCSITTCAFNAAGTAMIINSGLAITSPLTKSVANFWALELISTISTLTSEAFNRNPTEVPIKPAPTMRTFLIIELNLCVIPSHHADKYA